MAVVAVAVDRARALEAESVGSVDEVLTHARTEPGREQVCPEPSTGLAG